LERVEDVLRLFLIVVLESVSDSARRELRGAGLGVGLTELFEAGVSAPAIATFAFSFSVDPVGPGATVRLCCSVKDATADVRVGSGLSIVSQR
jgi:hypothetical protein